MNNKQPVTKTEDKQNNAVIDEQTNVPSYKMYKVLKDRADELSIEMRSSFKELLHNPSKFITDGVKSWDQFYVNEVKDLTDDPAEVAWLSYDFGRISEQFNKSVNPLSKLSAMMDDLAKSMMDD